MDKASQGMLQEQIRVTRDLMQEFNTPHIRRTCSYGRRERLSAELRGFQ